MSVTYHVGDTRDVTARIPDGSVSLVACSPPFIALRSYLPADHPDKAKEIGSEPDPAAFVDVLLALTAEWGRVLAPWGSIAIELGDTFSSLGATVDQPRGHARAWVDSAEDGNRMRGGGPNWPRAKCLALVPEAYRLSLAYGRNVLNGNPSPAGSWLVRNVITWHRPNPAVGALGDKYRPSTSQIVVATRSPKRWFDLTAVRGDATETGTRKVGMALASKGIAGGDSGNPDKECQIANPAGAPPLDCWFDEYDGTADTWTITTQPSSLAHYAMWPAKLAERLILSMCPAEVCTFCREPRRRIEAKSGAYAAMRAAMGGFKADRGRDGGLNGTSQYHNGQHIECAETETLGWTDCGHDAYTPGTVLDPFAGTGTTLAVADLYHRDAIGIDIDARNHDLYPARRAEVARNLFGSPIPDANQLDIFGELTA